MALSGTYARYAEQDEPGLYLVYPHDDRVSCTCDIFVIHGLHGGATKTWKHPTSGTIWFRDLLPDLIRDEGQGATARIWTYGYPASVAFQTATIYEFAQALLNRVKDVRKDNNDRKIIWICHSLGGLVLKQALIEAKIHPRFSSISAATTGIVFMGTPHHGSGTANLGVIVSTIVSSALPGAKIFNREILRDLRRNNNTLFGISSQFSNICSSIAIHSFHETVPLGPTIIVDKSSAIMHLSNEQKRYPINANHRDMCRFRDGLDQNWFSVGSSVVELVTLSAPGRVREAPNVRRPAATQASSPWAQRQPPSHFPIPPAGTYPNPGPPYSTQTPRRVPVPNTAAYPPQTPQRHQRSATPTYAPPQLPSGWVAQWDVETGKYFFVERETGVVEWDPPRPRQPQNDRLYVPGPSHQRSASADPAPSRTYPALSPAHSRDDFGASYRSQATTAASPKPTYQAYQPQAPSRPAPPQSSVSAAPAILPRQRAQAPEDDESSNRESATCDGCLCGIKCSEPRVQCTICYDYDLCIKCFQAGKETKDHKNTHKVSHVLNTALITNEDLIPANENVNPEFNDKESKSKTYWSIAEVKRDDAKGVSSYRWLHLYNNDSHARFLTSARPGHYAVSVVLMLKLAEDIDAAGTKKLAEDGAGFLRVSLGTVKAKREFFGAALGKEDQFNSNALSKDCLPHRLLNHYWWDVRPITLDGPYLHVQSDALLNIEGDESGALTDLGLILQWSGCPFFTDSNDAVVMISVEHIRMDNLLDYNEPYVRAPAPAKPKPAPAPAPPQEEDDDEEEEEPTAEEMMGIFLNLLRQADAQEQAALRARLEAQYRREEQAKRELAVHIYLQALKQVLEEQERQQQLQEQRERQQAAARLQAAREQALGEMIAEAYLEQYLKGLGLR